MNVEQKVAKLEDLLERVQRNAADGPPITTAAATAEVGSRLAAVEAAPRVVAAPPEPAPASQEEIEELDLDEEEIVDLSDEELEMEDITDLEPESSKRPVVEPPIKTPPPESGRQAAVQVSTPMVVEQEPPSGAWEVELPARRDSVDLVTPSQAREDLARHRQEFTEKAAVAPKPARQPVARRPAPGPTAKEAPEPKPAAMPTKPDVFQRPAAQAAQVAAFAGERAGKPTSFGDLLETTLALGQ